MKVIKSIKKYRTLSLRINEKVMKEIDKVSTKEGVSRQKLIEAIIEHAVSDKKFSIGVEISKPVN